jgi:predicted RNA-binding Zn ribbon-like protein
MTKLAELLKSNTSKFAAFLTEAKIDPARLMSASHVAESLRPEDRAIKLAKKLAAGKDDDASKAARTKKPRSGRPVTDRLVRAAIAGQSVSGPAKHRLLRAVNAVREAKKQPAAELRALF